MEDDDDLKHFRTFQNRVAWRRKRELSNQVLCEKSNGKIEITYKHIVPCVHTSELTYRDSHRGRRGCQ